MDTKFTAEHMKSDIYSGKVRYAGPISVKFNCDEPECKNEMLISGVRHEPQTEDQLREWCKRYGWTVVGERTFCKEHSKEKDDAVSHSS